jgi:uncharacterized membrane protein YdjX (TVP38/TMEM64 family)
VQRICRVGPWVRLAALAVSVGSIALVIALAGDLSADRLQRAVNALGVLAVVAFVPLSAALTVVLVPVPVVTAAAGLLFGTVVGFPIALVAMVLGSTAAALIARRGGAGAVEEIAGERVRRVRAAIERRGFLAVLYARVIPGMPHNLVNYAAGLTRIPLATFAAATALGKSPRVLAYVALGGTFGDFTSPVAIVAVAILVAFNVLGGVLLARDVRRSRRRRTHKPDPGGTGTNA